MLEADKLISDIWEWDFNLADCSQCIVHCCSSFPLNYLLSVCGWNVKLPHRSALTINESKDNLLCALSLGLVHISSTAPGKAFEYIEPRESLRYFKVLSWELQDLSQISPTCHAKRSYVFDMLTNLKAMIENERIHLVGTIRDLGQKDHWDLCQSPDMDNIGCGDHSWFREITGDNLSCPRQSKSVKILEEWDMGISSRTN